MKSAHGEELFAVVVDDTITQVIVVDPDAPETHHETWIPCPDGAWIGSQRQPDGSWSAPPVAEEPEQLEE